MKNKLRNVIVIAILLIISSSNATFADSDSSVNVGLQYYKITLNGTTIDNTYLEYPFIVYNNITYFPMTYNDCRFIGVETDWKGTDNGLVINATGVTAAYNPATRAKANSGSYTASIVDFRVNINGKIIDNTKEQYPLLTFRNITYFPMTWQHCTNEFFWNYSFDETEGLSIEASNIKLEQVKLSNDIAKDYDGNISHQVAVTDKDVYYQNQKGQIVKASLSDTSQIRTVYQLPLNYMIGDGSYVSPRLHIEDGSARIDYWQGGATMGSGYTEKINIDSSVTGLPADSFKSFDDKSFWYATHTVGGLPAGNLQMRTFDNVAKSIGDPDYVYGWRVQSTENGSISAGPSKDMYLVGDEIYILAYDTKATDKTTTGIYKININNNETVRVSTKEALSFKMDGDYLYYQNEGTFYRISIKDNIEETLKSVASKGDSIYDFEVLNGHIYWVELNTGSFYNVDGVNLNSGAIIEDIKIEGSNNEYLVCTFKETSNSKYRIMVFDKDENVVFKTSDKAYGDNIYITGEVIYFYNNTTKMVCIGELN